MVELVAVLALAALLTATAAVSFASYRRTLALSDAGGQIAWADAIVRDAARVAGTPTTLRVDLADRRVARLDADGRTATLADLPAGVRIERCVIAGEAAGFGNVDVTINGSGRSASYAILLVDRSGRRDWIVVAGLTGQVVHAHDASIDELLASPAFRGGADAD